MATDYCTRAQIESVFGVKNISSWGDLDNDENTANIAARIAAKITLASAEVDSILRRSRIDLDIIASDIPVQVVNATAELVGVLLYESRGIDDAGANEEEATSVVTGHRNRALEFLRSLVAGSSKLEAKYYDDDVGSIPIVVAG